jgi:hypothetical protein
VLEPDYDGTVEVTGFNPSTGELLWFAPEDEDPATSLVVDSEAPGVLPQGRGWKEFPSYLYFPRAGCYVLTAEWPGGAWRLGFGLGR